MPRQARRRGPKGMPWYRKFNDTWYAPKVKGNARPILDADGQPVRGEGNREQAMACWHEMVARAKAPTKGLDNPLKLIFEEFLEHTHRHQLAKTYEDYRRALQTFKDKWPDLTVNNLSQRHVDSWFDAHTEWSSTTRHVYLTTVLAALNRAAKPAVRLIPYNPLMVWPDRRRQPEVRADQQGVALDAF
jgi:hypothetical protein